jgi:hypothetical protein
MSRKTLPVSEEMQQQCTTLATVCPYEQLLCRACPRTLYLHLHMVVLAQQ